MTMIKEQDVYTFLYNSPFSFGYEWSLKSESKMKDYLLEHLISDDISRSPGTAIDQSKRPCGHIFQKGEGVYRCRYG